MKPTNNKIFLFLLLVSLFPYLLSAQEAVKNRAKSSWELFPILNYDTDVGFGYGAKGFFYNFLNTSESFDLTIYNSTKGERWYQFVYSVPDKQRRQGKKYELAFDFTVDYDKWINYGFYHNAAGSEISLQPNSKLEDFENYIREPIELSTLFSRAFTKDFIAEVGIKFKSISCYNFDVDGILKHYKPVKVQQLSFLLNFGIDTRTEFIHPKHGIVVKINNELSRDVSGTKKNFFRIGLLFQSYFEIIKPEVIWASRLKLETQNKTSYQNLLGLGGNKSVRGIPQDRYLSSSYVLLNEEIRIPILWRFGGVAGLDIGNSPSTSYWIINAVLGIRFYMNNFIVRADFGIGKETTGFYFNFGHLF